MKNGFKAVYRMTEAISCGESECPFSATRAKRAMSIVVYPQEHSQSAVLS